MAGIFHFVSFESPQDFARAVKAALPRGHEHHEEGELLVLDRPDLALTRRGWSLCLSRQASGATLSLRRLDRQARLSTPAPLQPPQTVHDVRAPRLQARLETLLGDAPLRVVQRWHSRGFRHDCRNDDDKIECTLVANQYRGLHAKASTSPVLIELVPKRGYQQETAALASRLQLPWQALEHDLMHRLEALHLADLAAQQASLPRARRAAAPVAVALLLLAHEATMRASVDPAAGAPAVEELHDFRVAMRRSRSLLRAFRKVLGRDLEEHFSVEFRWLARATSRLRDIDVLAAALTEPSADYAALAVEDRERVVALLAQERRRDAERLQQVLTSKRYARLRRDWPAALATVVHHPHRDAPQLEVTASQAIRTALARVRRDVTAVEVDYSPTALHELRKQCKRLRYLAEPFASLYPREGIADALGQLKTLQTMMGEICDRHAQLALLQGHLWRRAKRDAELRAGLKRARKHLRERLANSDVSAVMTALAQFDSRRHHAALDALFHAPKP